MPDLAEKVRVAVAAADVDRLRAAVTLALNDLHVEHQVRDELGNYRYSVCRECCTDDKDNQTTTCLLQHEHSGAAGTRCWPCTTWYVVARGLGLRA
jgi:hypothetical protein